MPDKPIRYSAHLQGRLALRRIESDLPRKLVLEARHRYSDEATGYRIAVDDAEYRGRRHLMAVVYEETETEIIAVTVHPLERADVEAKLRSGRWR